MINVEPSNARQEIVGLVSGSASIAVIVESGLYYGSTGVFAAIGGILAIIAIWAILEDVGKDFIAKLASWRVPVFIGAIVAALGVLCLFFGLVGLGTAIAIFLPLAFVLEIMRRLKNWGENQCR